MARRKQSKTRLGSQGARGSQGASAPPTEVPGSGEGSKTQAAAETDAGSGDPSAAGQTPRATVPVNAAGRGLAIGVSVAIVIHLFALFLSYSAIVEPSSSHSGLLDALAPYLRSTHFAADGRRFYLARDTPDEQPHRLQFATAGRGSSAEREDSMEINRQTEWTTIEPQGIAGLAASDRYVRWMNLAATLAESDQSSLVAALMLPLVNANDSIDAIRIVRLPTQLTTVTEDAAPPVYLARVIRSGDQVRLVSIGAKRLSTYQRQDSQRSPQDPTRSAEPTDGEASER